MVFCALFYYFLLVQMLMLNSFSMDRPATLRDIEQLLTAVSSENFYIKSEDYRKKIGLGKTQFSHLKQLGRFDKGTHKATLGSRRILIHKFFNMNSQKIEWFGNEKITSNKRGKK
jgi:hypothetical protein